MNDHEEPRDPESPQEWQEAVDAAHVMLAIDAARPTRTEGGPSATSSSAAG